MSDAALRDKLALLVDAISAQTKMIGRLVEVLVIEDAGEQDPDDTDPDAPLGRYMDGSPIR